MGTLQPAKLGGFGIYPQVSLGSEPSSVDFYWFKHNMNDVGVQQVVRDLGQLVGASLLPAGQVKAGAFAGGRVTMPPALDDYIGWLFYALAGAQQATPDDNGDGTYIHYYPSKAGGDSTTPQLFLNVHKRIPTDGTYDMGENLLDMTTVRCQLAIAGGQFVSTTWEYIGVTPSRVTVTKASPEQGWDTYGTGSGGTYAAKGKDSVPIASKGLIELPVASSLEGAQTMTIDIANVVPGYDDVAVIASYYPHSWPVLNRVPVIAYRQLYTSRDLYETIFYAGDGTWNPAIFNSSLLVESQSPEMVKNQVDTEQGNLSYSGSAGSETFTDDTQDFSDYSITAPGTATHWIIVTNSDGSTTWAYLGDDDGVDYDEVDVYKDIGCTVRGWNALVDPTGKTPSSYYVHAAVPYKLGFKAMSVDWSATPVALPGGDLVRLDVRGQLADADSGLDWHLYLQNKTASYTWPT